MFFTNLTPEYDELLLEICDSENNNNFYDDIDIEFEFDIKEFKDYEEDKKEPEIKKSTKVYYSKYSKVFPIVYKNVFDYLNQYFHKNKDLNNNLVKIKFDFAYIRNSFFIHLCYCNKEQNKKWINKIHLLVYENYDEIIEYFNDNFEDYFNLSLFNYEFVTNYIYKQNTKKYKMFNNDKFFKKLSSEFLDDPDLHEFYLNSIEDTKDFIEYCVRVDGIEHLLENNDSDFEYHHFDSDNILMLKVVDNTTLENDNFDNLSSLNI